MQVMGLKHIISRGTALSQSPVHPSTNVINLPPPGTPQISLIPHTDNLLFTAHIHTHALPGYIWILHLSLLQHSAVSLLGGSEADFTLFGCVTYWPKSMCDRNERRSMLNTQIKKNTMSVVGSGLICASRAPRTTKVLDLSN